MSRVSKFLSYVLRHNPGQIGIILERDGWVAVDALLAAMATSDHAIDRGELEAIVRDSDKQRFAFDATGSKIRANQGHSLKVDLGYEPHQPPDRLYHGTIAKFVDRICTSGLVKGARHHVHLSTEIGSATVVAERRGAPVILTIAAGRMFAAGHVFFVSANGVWLTDHVPPEYISFPK